MSLTKAHVHYPNYHENGPAGSIDGKNDSRKSNKVVIAADGGFMPARSMGHLGLSKLKPEAREAIIVQ